MSKLWDRICQAVFHPIGFWFRSGVHDHMRKHE